MPPSMAKHWPVMYAAAGRGEGGNRRASAGGAATCRAVPGAHHPRRARPACGQRHATVKTRAPPLTGVQRQEAGQARHLGRLAVAPYRQGSARSATACWSGRCECQSSDAHGWRPPLHHARCQVGRRGAGNCCAGPAGPGAFAPGIARTKGDLPQDHLLVLLVDGSGHVCAWGRCHGSARRS